MLAAYGKASQFSYKLPLRTSLPKFAEMAVVRAAIEVPTLAITDLSGVSILLCRDLIILLAGTKISSKYCAAETKAGTASARATHDLGTFRSKSFD